MEGLQSAFRALSFEEVDTHPVKRKREREKDAGESIADEGADQGHDPRMILPSRAHQALLASTHHPLL